MFKKLLSILLVCALMAALVPLYASAEEEAPAAWNAVAEAIGQPDMTEDASVIEAVQPNFKVTRDIGTNSYTENEYNDDIYYADMLYNDYTVYGDVSGYDLDYFAFELTQASDVIFVSASPSDGVWLAIFDETGEICLWAADIYYDSDYGYYNNIIEHYLRAGIYYLVILDYNTSSTVQEYMFYYASAPSSAAHTHDYTWDYWVNPEPTCTATGTQRNYCNCGAYSSTTLPSNGHTWNSGVVTVQPTCTSTGNKVLTCYDCGTTKNETVPKAAHTFVNGYCSVCGEREPLFPDAPWGQYYSTPIEWAVNNGITTGLSATRFGVDENCTRAQFVTFLWRAAGCPAPTTSSNPFTDVLAGQFYSDAVLWAVENGYTTGLSATKFGVNDPCTRDQVVTFLWRYAGKPAPTSSYNPFGDVLADQFYSDAILWAVENGITNGMSATKFGVNVPCNRAMVVTFLYRAVAQPA